MRFSDCFPLDGPDLLPKGPWKKPRQYVPADDECYGLPTGKRNGVWVLDLDTKGGKNGLLALQAHMVANDHADIPDTYTVRTKSGGLHLYWALPDGVSIGNRTGVLEGVDVRGERGFVRAGAPLYPVIADIDPVLAPEWLTSLVTSSRQNAPSGAVSAIAIGEDHPEWHHRIDLAAAYLADAPPCVQGQGGDAQLWKVALTLTRTYELPLDLCLELLQPYNDACVPPWDEAALTRKLVEAATKGEGITGTFPQNFIVAPLVPPAATVPAGPVSTWRQRKNPDHKYTFDPAVDIAGTGRNAPIYDRELTSAFTGPGAMPEWAGVWQYDLFAKRMMAVNPPLKLRAEDTGFDSFDLIAVKMWMLCTKGYFAKSVMLEDAIKQATAAASFHPVREYLEELPPPAPESLYLKSAATATTLFGSTPADAPHVVAYLRKWMIGCVARIMAPGSQFDTVLTLVGTAGWRKSTFFKLLATKPEWYRSSLPDISDPQKVGLALRGQWVVELGDLTTFRSSQRESFLEFITRTSEKFRAPYERIEGMEKRQCGIGATANTIQFLSQFDGGMQRRFLPIEVKQRINTEWLQEHLDELWAEARIAFEAGEPWWVNDEQTLHHMKEDFTDATPIEELASAFLESNANRRAANGKTSTEIYQLIFGTAQREVVPTQAQRQELGRLLRNTVGVTPSRTSGKRFFAVLPLLAGVPVAWESLTPKSAGDPPAGFFAPPT